VLSDFNHRTGIESFGNGLGCRETERHCRGDHYGDRERYLRTAKRAEYASDLLTTRIAPGETDVLGPGTDMEERKEENMENSAIVPVQIANPHRANLLTKRSLFANKIAVIDKAIALLDANPEIEELVDLMKEATRDDY
jgi:hypothetical protein